MKFFTGFLLVCFVFVTSIVYAQSKVDAAHFFTDTSTINATLTVNIGRILAHREKEGYTLPATFNYTMDNMNMTDSIDVELRGHFRRDYCYLPPLKLIFNHKKGQSLYHLKSLKLVSVCRVSGDYDQYILKEYIIYKIYNLFTDQSFRARLLQVNYEDSSGKKKGWAGHAFFIEDIKDVAKRNNCYEWTKTKVATSATNRLQSTMVAVFEYMIGNTDFAIPVNHNIRLLEPLHDSASAPFVVPYDFDYSGLVNTLYAIPDDRLGIENVRQRVYRGLPRQMGEVNEVLDIFKAKKDSIYSIINNFNLLQPATKRDMLSYLDEFYNMINDPGQVKETFITNAGLH